MVPLRIASLPAWVPTTALSIILMATFQVDWRRSIVPLPVVSE
jgi:hypothetical protein